MGPNSIGCKPYNFSSPAGRVGSVLCGMIGSRRQASDRELLKAWVPPCWSGNSPVPNNVHRPRKYGVRSNAGNNRRARAGVASAIFLVTLETKPATLRSRLCWRWLSATIVDADTHRNRVRVHFKGWNSRYDEWFTATELKTRAKPMQRITNARLRSKPARGVPPSGNNFGDVKAKIRVACLPARISKLTAEANTKEMHESATRVPGLQYVLLGEHGHINFDAGMSWKVFRDTKSRSLRPYGLNSRSRCLYGGSARSNTAAAASANRHRQRTLAETFKGKSDDDEQSNTNSKRSGNITCNARN